MYQYQITDKLLSLIRQIATTLAELDHLRLSGPVLYELEKVGTITSAYSSTSIEGNSLPITEVKKLLKSIPRNLRDSEREVVNYNAAILQLNKEVSRPNFEFSVDLILQIHRLVMHKLLPKGQTGRLRNQPVFVNDPKLRKTIYWPPDHGDVEPLLLNLITFLNKNTDRIDPLILAGIFHKQFMIIHPFLDGNGRTGRLATKVLLANMGYDFFNIFSFENYYNQNVARYFEMVGIKGDFYDHKTILYTNWLEYFAEGILDEILRVRKQINLQTVVPQRTLSQDQQKIIEHIQKAGFIQDADYARLTKRAKATRILDFKKLIDLGRIERYGAGRATYYKLKT